MVTRLCVFLIFLLNNVLGEEIEPSKKKHFFDLANTYMNSGELPLALETYKERSLMGGDAEEVFLSLYKIGELQELLESPLETIISSYCKAYHYRPSRAEPLFRLASYFLNQGHYSVGYAVAKVGVLLPLPSDTLSVETWIYDYGLLYIIGRCACFLKKDREAEAALEQVVVKQNVDPSIRRIAEACLQVTKVVLLKPMHKLQ